MRSGAMGMVDGSGRVATAVEEGSGGTDSEERVSTGGGGDSCREEGEVVVWGVGLGGSAELVSGSGGEGLVWLRSA